MKSIQVAVVIVITIVLATTWAQSQKDFHAAYEARQVFTLRAEVTGAATAPPFYRGALEAAANDITTADKLLHSGISAAPHSDQAYESHDILGNMFFRNGMYRAFLGEIKAALAERSDACDQKQMLPIATALNNFPEMTVASLRPSALRIEPKSIFLPLQLNGQDAEFFSDTGAGSRSSESQRLKSSASRPKLSRAPARVVTKHGNGDWGRRQSGHGPPQSGLNLHPGPRSMTLRLQ